MVCLAAQRRWQPTGLLCRRTFQSHRIGLLVGRKTSEAATGAADRSRICAEKISSRQRPCEGFVHVVLVDAQYTDVAVGLIRRRGLPAKGGCNYFQGGSWRSRREIKYFCR